MKPARRPLDISFARQVPSSAVWRDLSGPVSHLERLKRISKQVRERRPGQTVLFSGPSGSGKTLAARVLATDLGAPLYRVDLAAVVNKYIGETEKNISKLLDAAAVADVVLFFDEADALFGRRTSVSDAHDRYANIEIDYLLQRLENHPGLVILATNARDDLDPDFTRRVRHEIDFPGSARRHRLWTRLLNRFRRRRN